MNTQRQRISHYRVVRRLGSGGMGEVLLAEDRNLERFVALKVMSPELAKEENQRKRFLSEAKAASGLSHPNVCVMHDVGQTEDGRPFLAMEYVEGQTLETVMGQRRLKLREVVRIGKEVVEALAAAHERHLVHRDIKPANIMLERSGRVKVLDFGLAKRLPHEDLSLATTAQALTQSGVLIGTPHYMSPEQALGRKVDHRTDVFSLGVVLYEMATGQRPFLGRTVGETINNVVNQAPEPLGLENPLFSPGLDGIIFRCLEKDPEKRYATAKELATDLARLESEFERELATRKETPAETPAVITSPATERTKLWHLVRKQKQGPGFVVGIAVAIILVVAVMGAYRWLQSRVRTDPGSQAASKASATAVPKSVAVLPFDNFSAEKDSEYLSDGLTDEITTALSRVPGLKVAARNSAFTFKGRKEDLRKVGATLGVATLLEGSVRKSGQQVRVTAQLINVADGFHLWSETYDRDLKDIIAVQEEIARKIAERFELKPGATLVEAKAGFTPKPEAYALYLQGLQLLNKRTEESLEGAVQFFKRAVELEPGYAAAHAGLAACYAVLPGYSLRLPAEYLRLGEDAARKALEFDSGSADAHAALGLIKSYRYEIAEAEAEFQRALHLNPNHATAHHWYGVQLRELGRMEDSWRELRRAEELDPLSPIIKFNLVTWTGYARQYEKAVQDCKNYLRAFPDFALFHGALASLYTRQNRFPEALAELEKARSSLWNSPYYLEGFGYIYARNGNEGKAREILAELQEWRKKGYAVGGMIAFVYLGLRDYDKAIEAGEAALAAHEGLPFGFLQDPAFDELRDLPKCKEMMKKYSLPGG